MYKDGDLYREYSCRLQYCLRHLPCLSGATIVISFHAAHYERIDRGQQGDGDRQHPRALWLAQTPPYSTLLVTAKTRFGPLTQHAVGSN